MKTLFLIPARGGSKGIPGKNIRLLNGEPLICYAIDEAREMAEDKDICVSTDSDEIVKTVEQYGLKVPFMRPLELAGDKTGTYEVCLHAIEYFLSKEVAYEVLVILQPTSPFRKSYHVREALSLYREGLDMVVSVKETRSNPYYVLFEEDNNGFLEHSKKSGFVTRQDCPKVWEYNGAVYVINVRSLIASPISQFKKVRKYVMDEESSLDLDTEMDWKFVEFLINEKDLKR